ncbi:unnamed protein product [Closterium sp. NIES-65]|nr:unnamed protein product [Closterium sp. NIES-65]
MAHSVLQAARRGPLHPRLLVTFVSLLALLPAACFGATRGVTSATRSRAPSPRVQYGDCIFAHQPGLYVTNAIINYTSQLLTYSPHHPSAQPESHSRRPFLRSSPGPPTPLKPDDFPTRPHHRTLFRGVDEAESGVLGRGGEEGEGKDVEVEEVEGEEVEEEERSGELGEGEEAEEEEGSGEVGEGEEEMVQVVKGVVGDGAWSAAHASTFTAPVGAGAVSGAGAAIGGGGGAAASGGGAAASGGGAAASVAASEQQAALDGSSFGRYNLTEARIFLAHLAGKEGCMFNRIAPTSARGVDIGKWVFSLCTWDSHSHASIRFYIIASAMQYNGSHTAMPHHIGHQPSCPGPFTLPPLPTPLHSSQTPSIALHPLTSLQVWDSFIIATAIYQHYSGSITAMLHHIAHQLSTDWRPLIPAWASCLGDIASPAPNSGADASPASTLSPAQAVAYPAV